jgi:hypothetical protein
MKYQVQIKYTNPSHEHVSLRRRVESITRLVEAANEQEAINRATRQQRALGFIIKEAEAYAPVTGLHSLALNNNEPQKNKEKKKELVGKDGEKTDIAASGGVKEGFDTDPKDIAAYLVDRHGKGKVTMDHIEAYERRRDSHRPIEKNAVMQHVKKMSEEVEQMDEASHVAYLKPKANAPSDVKDHFDLPVHSDSKKDAHSKFAKVFGSNMAKHYEVVHVKPKAVKEEVEAVDESAKDWKRAFGKVAQKNLTKDLGSIRSKVARMDYIGLEPKVSERPVTARDKNRKELGEANDVTKDLRTSMKAMDLRQGVDSDKRVSGYKMSDAVRKAQKKSDELSKVEKKPQAGTLSAQKSRKAAERMVNRAKGNANKIDVAPTIEPGKPNLQR